MPCRNLIHAFDLQEKPMGRKTVRFMCHHSGHCCTDVVCLPTPWDVLRIAQNTGENPYAFLEFLTPEEINDVHKNDPSWLQVNGQKYIMALRRHSVKGCYFLDRKTKYCRIYEQRPLLCRLYPFKLQESKKGDFRGFALHRDVGCPRHKNGVAQTQPLYDLYLQDRMHQDDYATLVKAFNRDTTPEKNPEDFLKLFIEIIEGKQPQR